MRCCKFRRSSAAVATGREVGKKRKKQNEKPNRNFSFLSLPLIPKLFANLHAAFAQNLTHCDLILDFEAGAAFDFEAEASKSGVAAFGFAAGPAGAAESDAREGAATSKA
jgi:hypothetical protein